MGEYLEGKVIKHCREALGMTQEQLAEGVCEPETLSRYENGKKGISRKNYARLMRKMGQNEQKQYFPVRFDSLEMVEKKEEFLKCIRCSDYEQAGKILEILKEHIVLDVYGKQFLETYEAVVKRKLGQISDLLALSKIEHALSYTIDIKKEVNWSEHLYTTMELDVLLNLLDCYQHRDRGEDYQKIVDGILTSVQENITDRRDITYATYLINYIHFVGENGDYEKSLEMTRNLLEFCKAYKIIYVLPEVFESLKWNQEQINKRDGKEVYTELENLKKSYYISRATGSMAQEILGKLWEEQYHNEDRTSDGGLVT